MRTIILAIVTVLAFGSAAGAQSSPSGMPGVNTTPGETLPLPTRGAAPDPDAVINDEVAAKAVKPARCGAAAMETDGTTTCIGLQDAAPPNSRKRHR
jgi:hypothetical protein